MPQQIEGQCYDDVPRPPSELRPMLRALFHELLERELFTEEDTSAISFFGMWCEQYGVDQ